MKKINKNISPTWFEDWKTNFSNNSGRIATYKDDFAINKLERRKLREDLIEEQGYICCYCMSRIEINNSHIEHFWPKFIFENMDMDYSNLLASCQGVFPGEDHCGHKKNDWYNESMVPPTDSIIEQMFSYTADGEIHHKGSGIDAHMQKAMIENLGLDSYNLIRNRQAAIEASEYMDDVQYRDYEIEEFVEFYQSKENGKYTPFCMAIIDCLKHY